MDQKVSILKTLTYHDIFQYPLTVEEIRSYLISSKINTSQLKKQLEILINEREIESSKGYYFLKKKKPTVAIRIARQKNSINKLKKANFYAKILKLVPTIQMVAVSGALAMENSRKIDDIDLVIIAKTGTLWTTRLITSVLLFPFKRKSGSKKTDNRACLNLFLDESDLKIEPQNIYQAHEICQMKPLWSRNKTYSRFIQVNKWVLKFLPNWQPEGVERLMPKSNSSSSSSSSSSSHLSTFPARFRLRANSLAGGHFQLVEIFLKKLQLLYMKKKISTERIGDTQLFFHPANTQELVLMEYNRRLKKLGLLR